MRVAAAKGNVTYVARGALACSLALAAGHDVLARLAAKLRGAQDGGANLHPHASLRACSEQH